MNFRIYEIFFYLLQLCRLSFQRIYSCFCFFPTAQKMKISIKNFLQIWSHLLNKFLIENFIFCELPLILNISLVLSSAGLNKWNALSGYRKTVTISVTENLIPGFTELSCTVVITTISLIQLLLWKEVWV